MTKKFNDFILSIFNDDKINSIAEGKNNFILSDDCKFFIQNIFFIFQLKDILSLDKIIQ